MNFRFVWMNANGSTDIIGDRFWAHQIARRRWIHELFRIVQLVAEGSEFHLRATHSALEMQIVFGSAFLRVSCRCTHPLMRKRSRFQGAPRYKTPSVIAIWRNLHIGNKEVCSGRRAVESRKQQAFGKCWVP